MNVHSHQPANSEKERELGTQRAVQVSRPAADERGWPKPALGKRGVYKETWMMNTETPNPENPWTQPLPELPVPIKPRRDDE